MTRILDEILFLVGMLVKLKRLSKIKIVLRLHVIRYFSFMSRMENFLVNCINDRPMCFWVCRSILLRTRF